MSLVWNIYLRQVKGMRIKQFIYERMLKEYPIPPPEQGGILGMKDDLICEYFHDDTCSITERAIYEPNVLVLNQKIEEWDNQGIQFAGIVHSHMAGQYSLSSSDKEYIKALFDELPEKVKKLYFPIIVPEDKLVIAFVAKRSNKDVIIQSDEVHIIT